jgi:hypothetical protein
VLELVLLAYAALLALWALIAAILRRPRGPAHAVGLVLLELGLVVQAVMRALGVAAGDQPARPAAHVGYLAASVVLLPLLLGVLRPGGGGSSRSEDAWHSAVVATACVVVMIVVVRIVATGPARP